MTEPDRIAALLSESLAQHRHAFKLRHDGDAAAARMALSEARRLRLDAEALDPEHEAPAWADEQRHTPRGKDTHAEMLAFYAQQAGA